MSIRLSASSSATISHVRQGVQIDEFARRSRFSGQRIIARVRRGIQRNLNFELWIKADKEICLLQSSSRLWRCSAYGWSGLLAHGRCPSSTNLKSATTPTLQLQHLERMEQLLQKLPNVRKLALICTFALAQKGKLKRRQSRKERFSCRLHNRCIAVYWCNC